MYWAYSDKVTLNGALNYARDTRAAIFRLGQFTKGNSQVSFQKPEYSGTWLPVCLESEHQALKLPHSSSGHSSRDGTTEPVGRH